MSVDLRDEEQRTLHLMTRQENTEITELALLTVIREALGIRPSNRVRNAIARLLYREGDEAQFARAFVATWLSADAGITEGSEAADRIRQITADLALNTLLWVPLAGVPGERRVLKFSYDLSDIRPPVRVHTRDLQSASWEVDQELLRVERHGRLDVEATWQRQLKRILSSIGWDAIDVLVELPNMRDCDSYHLQVFTPDGADVISVRTEGPLRDVAGMTIEPRMQFHGSSAHLYVSGRAVKETAPVAIAIRVPRSGFLNLCALLSLLVAALLWSLQAMPVKGDTPKQVAATVLLVIPAVLIVVGIRPLGESALMSSLLAGMRGLMLASGLLAAAAGAALAGVQPFDHIEETYIWYATSASVIAGVLVCAWLAAGARTRETLARVLRAVRNAPVGRAQVLALMAAPTAILVGSCVALLKRAPITVDHPVMSGFVSMACAVLLWMCSQLGRTSSRRGMPMTARYVAWTLAATAIAWSLRRFGVDPLHTDVALIAWVVIAACGAAAVIAVLACGRKPPTRGTDYNAQHAR
jgi:hypothetical protein